MPTAISQETSSYTGGTFAWDNSKRGSLTVPGGKDGELARIDMDTGKIYWNKREVTTDDDFRKVMMALAKGLWAKPCVKP